MNINSFSALRPNIKNRQSLVVVSSQLTLTANSSNIAFLNKYYHTKKVDKIIKFAFFTLEEFTFLNFEFKLQNLFLSNKTYSIFIKLSFSTGSEFRMAGRQIGFLGSDKYNKENIYSLYDNLLDKIKLSINSYCFLGEIDGIEISYFEIDILPELKMQDKIKSTNRLANKKELNFYFNNNILPLVPNENYYGDKLENTKKLNAFHLIKNNFELFPNNHIRLSLNDKFFLYHEPTSRIVRDYILKNEKTYIIVITKNSYLPLKWVTDNIQDSSELSYKHVFNNINGSYIFTALDHNIYTKINNINNQNTLNEYKSSKSSGDILYFDRTIDNTTLSIAVIPTQNTHNRAIKNIENKIFKSTIKVKLKPINSMIYSKRNQTFERNIKFGTFDLETFLDSDGNSKVFAAGFSTYLDHLYSKDKLADPDNNNLFYLTDFKDSNQLILTCINKMLVSKYHKYTFYCHNFGNYDLYFIYRVLEEYNTQANFLNKNKNKNKELLNNEVRTENLNYYNSTLIFRDNQVIKLDLKVKIVNPESHSETVVKITFLDSLNILDGSLEQLAKDYKVNTQKGKFPYHFVNKENLNYIGKIPPIEYFNSVNNKITQIEYDLMVEAYSSNWSLKKETLNYLAKDLVSLLEILNEFSKILYFKFNINMTEGMTISRLALNLFLKKYLPNISSTLLELKPDSKVIPLINKNHMFNFIYDAYFGGITEVYKPFGQDLKYIDVNSLYPYAALNPLPGCSCEYIQSYDLNSSLNLDLLFGFFYAKVKSTNGYLGLLPVRTKTGLIFPNGEYSGTWSSEELKFARDNGYEIKVINGYNFNKVENVFTNYIQDLYRIKSESKGSMKKVSKSLLNNLLGRLGLNIFKPITKVVNLDEMNYISSTRLIKSHKILTDNKFLVTYLPGLNKEVCFEHGIDPLKTYFSEPEQDLPIQHNEVKFKDKFTVFNDTSIAISAMVNSYARIYMNNIKLQILNAGGVIYYSDTDSIVYNNYDLPDKYIGSDLGQFKLEYDIKYAYFISNKTYCLVTKDNKTIIKAKGVIKESLTLDLFEDMYLNHLNVKALKTDTYKSFEFATVNLNQKEVILKYDSYLKRIKIFNDAGIWIDTKPLHLPLNS